MTAPRSILAAFFKDATQKMDELKIAEPLSSEMVRKLLLTTQSECLNEVVSAYNKSLGSNGGNDMVSVSMVQDALKNIHAQDINADDKKALEIMNNSARLAYARLVLYSECLLEGRRGLREKMQLKGNGSMSRLEILEFCGLCNAVVRLKNVEMYLGVGTQLFHDIAMAPAPLLPQQRLESIQKKLVAAMGYDPEYGTSEIKRIFFSSGGHEFANDQEVLQTFYAMANNMKMVLVNATMLATKHVLSDQGQGGVTRVVSVNLSENIIDAKTGEIQGQTTAPYAHTMVQQADEQQREQLRIAKDASALQQEILGELLGMRDEEREVKLEVAKKTADEFTQQLLQLPPGPERVAFFRSADSKTQRLMAMHKLWEGMLAANGGQPPTLRK